MKSRPLISLIFVFTCILVSGQNSCNNLDLEQGTFFGWNGFYGCNDERVDSYDMQFNASCEDFGEKLDPLANQINNLESQQSVVSADFNAGQDPYVNALKLQSPLGGNFIARVGDLYQNNRSGALTKTIRVNADNALLTIYYAIVLEAPGHAPKTNNPYFRIRLLDPNDQSVPCIEYTQDGATDADGFRSYNCTFGGFGCQSDRGPEGRLTEIVYRDWTAISINLQDYIGQDVELEVSAGGCALTGHLGYAYLDARCGKPEIIKSQEIVCNGNPATLTAPEGMQSYAWRLGSENGPVISTQNPLVTDIEGTYYCTMVPFTTANSTCPFTLNTSVIASNKLPVANFISDLDTICVGKTIDLTSTSTIVSGGSIKDLLWSISNGANGSGSSFLYTFNNPGLYTIEHVVESVEGCLDTASQTVEVFESFDPIIDPIPDLCNDDPVFTPNADPKGGIWENTIDQTGAIDPSIFNQDTSFTIRYSVGMCQDSVAANVNVLARKNAAFSVPSPLCSNAPALFLEALENGGIWSGSSVDRNGRFNPSSAGSGWHKITYQFQGACPSSFTDSILVIESKDARLPEYNPICILDEPFEIPVLSDGGRWSGATNNGVFDPSMGEGEYTVYYQFDGACPSIDSTIIRIVRQSDASFNAPLQVCEDEGIIQFIPVQNGGVFSGSGVTTQGTFDPALAGVGSHTINYTIDGACGDASTKIIEVLERPNPEFSLQRVFCVRDDDVQIVPNAPGGTWSGAVSASGVFSPSNLGPGLYTLNYSFGGLCPSESEFLVEVIDEPKPFFELPDTLCSNAEPINIEPLTSGGIWSLNAQNGRFDPNTSEGYHSIRYRFTGTCATEHIDSVFVKKQPEIIISGRQNYCLNEGFAQFTASPSGGTFSGTNIDQSGRVSFNGLSSGDYSFTYRIGGQCGDEKSYNFSLSETPNAQFSAPDTVCAGSESTLIPLNNGGTWSGQGVDDQGVFRTVNLVPDRSYTITYAFDGPCSDSFNRRIFIQSSPDASFTGPLSACTKEDAFTLIPTTAGGIWGGIADANGVVNPADHAPDQVYEVNYTIPGLCPSTFTQEISIRDFFRTEFDAPNVVCRNSGIIRLEAEDRGGGWFGDGITSAVNGTFDPTLVNGDTAIVRYVFTGICGSESSDTIIIKDAATPSLNPIDDFCWYSDTLVSLQGMPNGGVFIFNGDSTTSLSINPKDLSPGLKQVQYGLNGDCPAFVSQTFMVAEPFTVSDFGLKDISCSGNCDAQLSIKMNYNSTSALNFAIQTADTLILEKQAQGLCPNTYSIAIKDAFGCSVDTSVVIDNKPLPELFIHSVAATCGDNNGQLVLDSVKHIQTNGFLRLNGELFKDSIGNLAPGNYVVDYLSADGCQAQSMVNVASISGPGFIAQFTPPTCNAAEDASAFIISISGGTAPYNISWNTGSNVDSVVNLKAGTYSVSVSDANGCISSETFNIPETPAFEINADFFDATLCSGDSLQILKSQINGNFTASNYFINGNQWSTNDIYLAEGEHQIFATNAKGCQSNIVSININVFDSLNIELQTNAQEFCPGDELSLRANILSSAGTVDFFWNNESSAGATYQFIIPDAEGTKHLNLVAEDACMQITDSIAYQVRKAPVLALYPTDTLGCEPLSLVLRDSNDTQAQFFLNDKAIGANQESTLGAGTYSLRAAISNGVCAKDTVLQDFVRVAALPNPEILSFPINITTVQNQARFAVSSQPPLSLYNWKLIAFGQDTLALSEASDLNFSFPDTEKSYQIQLNGYTQDGCYGETIKYFDVKKEYHVFVPNTFTPNADGDNDVFKIESFNIDIKTFSLIIVDRWGHVVFESSDPDISWNGRFNQSSEMAPIGVYQWKLLIVSEDMDYIQRMGHVNLIR